MSSISSIGSGLILGFENFGLKSELTLQNMFQMLSIELGGDGETINKKDLDNYIDDAKDGIIEVSDKELSALTELQSNWDTIAGKGNDSITFSDMKNYSTILVMAISGGITSDNINDSEDLEPSIINNEDDANSSLNSVLKTILSDDKNTNLIDTLTNLIKAYSSISTIEANA